MTASNLFSIRLFVCLSIRLFAYSSLVIVIFPTFFPSHLNVDVISPLQVKERSIALRTPVRFSV
jgi:hypothetical protein